MSSTPPSGWYPDPESSSRQRYWDGSQWTEHTAPAAGGASWDSDETTSVTGAGGDTTAWPTSAPAGAAGEVNTWTWQSFVVTILCGGTFISMIGIYNAGKAEGALASGDVEGAREFARRARNWTLGGLAFGVFAIVAAVAVVVALTTAFADLVDDCAGVDESDGVQYVVCTALCDENPDAVECQGFEG